MQVENLDRLVMLVKKWSNDPRFDCKPQCGLKEFIAAEASLIENYDVIEEAGFVEELPLDQQHNSEL